MVAFAVVARVQADKGEDLTRAAAPEEKAGLGGSKRFLGPGFACAKSRGVCQSSQPVLSGLPPVPGAQGAWAWAGLRSHPLVKYNPRELSAMGNTSQMPFPMSCCAALTGVPGDSSVGEDGAGAVLGERGGRICQVRMLQAGKEVGRGVGGGSIPCSVPARQL